MSANITVMGASYEDVPSVQLPKTGGGTALFSDTSGTTAIPSDVRSGKKLILSDGSEGTGTLIHDWMGDYVETVNAPFYTFETTLDETGYPTWTPGTSATSILATVNCPTFVADMTEYEYMIEWLWYCQAAWPDGQTYTYCMDKTYGTAYQGIMRRPYGLDKFAANDWNYNYCTNLYTASMYNIYWNKSGARTWSTTCYGYYMSATTAAGLSSTTSNTPTITPKRPVISARCNSSYFTTTRAAQIDQENSTIKIVGNLYRMQKNTSPLHGMWEKAVNMYNNPL